MQLKLEYSEYNSRHLGTYGQTYEAAEKLVVDGLAKFFCTAFDTIVVGDVNSDARFILKSIIAGTCGLKKLIFLTTNRFDFGLSDVNDNKIFFNHIKYVVENPDLIYTKIIFVQNNPWESRYADYKMNIFMETTHTSKKNFLNYTLIRPFGFSFIPKSPEISLEEKNLPCYHNHPFFKNFTTMLLNSGLKVKIFDDLYYGGPSALSQYKAFITLSYQVSTMKIYENLAEGVVTYVPTVRFLKELVETKEFEYPFIRETFWDGENWFKNIEYYHDDITSYIYKFDSMEELKEKMEKENVDPLNVREKSKIFWREERIKSLKRWSNVLEIPIPTS